MESTKNIQNSILEVNDLSLSFGSNKVLKKLNFQLKKNEFVSILGKNGCGKTSILRLISNLISPSSGEINFNSTTTHEQRIGVIFQHAPLFPWLNLEENIRICMQNQNLSSEAMALKIKHLFGKAELNGYEHYFPNQVSGGMQQRVNFIRGICCDPEILLMDEPFSHIDYFQRLDLQNFTSKMSRELQTSILLVTHDVDEAVYLSNRILLLGGSPTKVEKEIIVNLDHANSIQEARKQKRYQDVYDEILHFLRGDAAC